MTKGERMELSGAQIICESLLREGVDTIFGIPGGAAIILYHVLYDYPIRSILTRHEQGAAHAADGYARATGKVGVCFATSGPGATNLVTGIATANLDSSPVLAITAQVGTASIGKDAFQEVDITGVTLPITKHNFQPRRVEELATVIKEAFHVVRTGRPGPVLVDVPKDIQADKTEFEYPESVSRPGFRPIVEPDPEAVAEAARLINQAEKPVLMAGHGITLSGAHDGVRELVELAQIPFVSTLLGISALPESHELSLGMVGMHGMAYANMAVQNADLLLVIGARFSDRVTGPVHTFAPEARLIHVDADPAEIGKVVQADLSVVGDAGRVVEELLPLIERSTHQPWLDQIGVWRREAEARDIAIWESQRMVPPLIFKEICRIGGENAVMVSDVGQNQMWEAQYVTHDRPNTLITSGGLGTMGFALPAGIGVQVGRPEEVVWVTTGDGGFQMNIQELATVVQERLPLKIAIINNGYLGMVRQWQEIFFEKRYSGTAISGPDFIKIAEAYGIAGFRAQTREEVGPAIESAMNVDGPALIDFRVEKEENVYPMVCPGSSISEMLRRPCPEEWEEMT